MTDLKQPVGCFKEPMVGISDGIVPLLSPEAGHIHWDAIIKSLRKLCRYTGHTDRFYSVLQHSLLVHDIVVRKLKKPEFKLHALVHDCHEAYIGDISTPVKQALQYLGAGDALKELDSRWMAAVSKASMIEWTEEAEKAVKKADYIALAWEKSKFLKDQPEWPGLPKVPRIRNCISYTDHDIAEDRFRNLLRDYLEETQTI